MPSPTNGHPLVHELVVTAGLEPDTARAATHWPIIKTWSQENKLLHLPGRDRPITPEMVAIIKATHAVRGWGAQGDEFTDLDYLRIAVRAGVPLREEAMARANTFAYEFSRDLVSLMEAQAEAARTFEELASSLSVDDLQALRTHDVFGSEGFIPKVKGFPALRPDRAFATTNYRDEQSAMVDNLQRLYTGESDVDTECYDKTYATLLEGMNAKAKANVGRKDIERAATMADLATVELGNPFELVRAGLLLLSELGVSPFLTTAEAISQSPQLSFIVDLMKVLMPKTQTEIHLLTAASVAVAMNAPSVLIESKL